jgi:hypothetical protein
MQPRKLVRVQFQENIQIAEARSSKLAHLRSMILTATNLKISTIFQNLQEICKNRCNSSKIWKKWRSGASLYETRHSNLNIFCSALFGKILIFYAHVLHNATAERWLFRAHAVGPLPVQAAVLGCTRAATYALETGEGKKLRHARAQHRVRVRTAESKRPIWQNGIRWEIDR